MVSPKEKRDRCYTLEEATIIAQTFVDNDNCHELLDSCESLVSTYRTQAEEVKKQNFLLKAENNRQDERFKKQTEVTKKLADAYDVLVWDNKKNKLLNSVVIGGLTISLATSLYLIVKPYIP